MTRPTLANLVLTAALLATMSLFTAHASAQESDPTLGASAPAPEMAPAAEPAAPAAKPSKAKKTKKSSKAKKKSSKKSTSKKSQKTSKKKKSKKKTKNSQAADEASPVAAKFAGAPAPSGKGQRLTPDAHLSREIVFDGSDVNGQYHSAGDAVAKVEQEKKMNNLVGIRQDFKDRIADEREHVQQGNQLADASSIE